MATAQVLFHLIGPPTPSPPLKKCQVAFCFLLAAAQRPCQFEAMMLIWVHLHACSHMQCWMANLAGPRSHGG